MDSWHSGGSRSVTILRYVGQYVVPYVVLHCHSTELSAIGLTSGQGYPSASLPQAQSILTLTRVQFAQNKVIEPVKGTPGWGTRVRPVKVCQPQKLLLGTPCLSRGSRARKRNSSGSDARIHRHLTVIGGCDKVPSRHWRASLCWHVPRSGIFTHTRSTNRVSGARVPRLPGTACLENITRPSGATICSFTQTHQIRIEFQ